MGDVIDQLVARAASLVTRTNPPRLFTEMGRHPRLFRAWLPFAGTLLLRGELPRADTELVILRTAWNCRSLYEWAQHVPMAERAGVTAEQIAHLPLDEQRPWTERQRLLLRATDELHRDRAISRATGAALETELSSKQLVELCVLVGHYEMLAMLLNSRHVEPDHRKLSQADWDLGHWTKRSDGRTLVA